MATLFALPRPSATERPAHLVRIAVPRLNKREHIRSYLEQIPTREYDLNWAEVTETRTMNVAEWNEFVTNLMTDRDWLASKGGAGNWSSEYDGMTDIQICNLEPEERKRYMRTVFLYVVAVIAPTGQTIYIDPEGYNYARYIAFPATERTAEGKTRAEIEKDQAQVAIAERKARIAHQIANPPPTVPANHGLRFFWNGMKANGGQLQRAYYSLGNLIDYPADTLSISARDYGSFSKEVDACFTVTNNSDPYSDYHDNDRIRVCSNHPLYSLVLEAYQAQEWHETARRAKRGLN
jgi:hypothetical protein